MVFFLREGEFRIKIKNYHTKKKEGRNVHKICYVKIFVLVNCVKLLVLRYGFVVHFYVYFIVPSTHVYE